MREVVGTMRWVRKDMGSMRKQVVPLRVDCGHFVRALRELYVTDASTVCEQDADTASRYAAYP